MALLLSHPLRALAICLLLLGGGWAAAYLVSEAVDPVFAPERAQFKRAAARGSRVQAIAIGNSHNHAVDFQTLGLEGEHLWDLGSDSYDVLVRFRHVRPELPELRYVFLPVSPFVVDNTAFASRERSRIKSYVIADARWPVDGDWKFVVAALAAPVAREDHWEGVGRALYRRLRAVRPTQAATAAPESTPGAVESPRAAAERLREHAAWRVPHHQSLFEESIAHNPELCEDARSALREIAREVAPARLVLFTPPLAPAYRRRYDREVGCELDRLAEALAAGLPNVSYYDDRDAGGFTDESGLFMDSDHLNPVGARRYSLLLLDRLSPFPRSGD